MKDVFISYSRRDKDFVSRLYKELGASKHDAWVDWEGILPAEDFPEAIRAGIEEASTFIFVLSPDSVVSDMCLKELELAVKYRKKILPLLYRTIDRKSVPQALQRPQWISFDENENTSFDAAFQKVLFALKTDMDYWPEVTRWLTRANSWDMQRKHNKSLLLRGKELRDAKNWLRVAERWRQEGSDMGPQPTETHIAFIHESRRATQRFLLSIIVTPILLITITITIAFLLLQSHPTLVTNVNDGGSGSLRHAITAANPRDTITFDAHIKGKIVLKSSLEINKDLTIRGPGADVLVVNGELSIRGARVSISGLTIGDIYNMGGTVTVSKSTISGGGITNTDGTFTLVNSTVSNNVGLFGGGIFNQGGSFTLMNSIVSNNDDHGGNGGGIFNQGGKLTLVNSTVSNNTEHNGVGGGIDNAGGGVLTLTNSTVSDNKRLNDNGLGSSGGGGIASAGTLTLINSTVSGNSVYHGGGGGIASFPYYDDTFGEYKAGGVLTLTNSTISDNKADKDGGGIAVADSVAHITFCTIYGNTTSGSGGGIATKYEGHFPLKVIMSKSIVARNQAHSNQDIAGTLTTQGYNLIGNPSGAVFLDLFTMHHTDLSGDQFTDLGIDSQLRENGGPTKTHRLLLGSPALDQIPSDVCQSNGISTDQRGIQRPQGLACDIGAYEYIPSQ